MWQFMPAFVNVLRETQWYHITFNILILYFIYYSILDFIPCNNLRVTSHSKYCLASVIAFYVILLNKPVRVNTPCSLSMVYRHAG